MKKRHRIDSISEQIKSVQAASQQIRPPAHVHLFNTAESFFKSIVEARERSSWNEADLVLAVTLANTQANAAELQKELAKEGDIVDGKPNPKHQLHEILCRRIIALFRLLQLHPGARLGAARDTGRRTQKEMDLLVGMGDDPDDDLLAKPYWHVRQ